MIVEDAWSKVRDVPSVSRVVGELTGRDGLTVVPVPSLRGAGGGDEGGSGGADGGEGEHRSGSGFALWRHPGGAFLTLTATCGGALRWR